MTTPPLTGLGRLLREASTVFNKVFRMRLAPLGVTYGQFQYLQSLWEADGLTQTELTRRVGIEIASSTAILDSLETLKFIRRVRSPTDRRKIHVYLTSAGAAMQDALTACAIATNTTARRGLSNAEIASLFGGLRRIVENMKSAAATDGEAEPAAARPKPPPRASRKASARRHARTGQPA
jgi:MarR family transcriptional regulator, organic hydroperoxide resistance regulator